MPDEVATGRTAWWAARPTMRHLVPRSNRDRTAPMVRRVADAAFAVAVLATLAYQLHMARGIWFFADEWAIAEQVRSPSGLIEPYNGHLSILILGLYRALLTLFGFSTHAPYRVAGVVAFLSIAVALYVVVRREVGTVAAVVAGAVLLWPNGITLESGGLNHSLAALGAIVCGYGLNGSGRRRDLLVGAGLAFALASAGGGVAVAAAAVVHSICTRPPWRRWIAVVVPTVLWGLWYVLFVESDERLADTRPGLGGLLRETAEQVPRSFTSLTLGNEAAGYVLLAGFLVVAALRLRRGLAESASVLAWSAALVTWWFGLVWSRWFLLETESVFRYQLVSAVCIVLALLPVGADVRATDDDAIAARLPWPERARSWATMPALAPLALVVALLVVVPPVRSDLRDWSSDSTAISRSTQPVIRSVAFGPEGMPDEPLSFYLAYLTPTEVRQLMSDFEPPARYGEPDRYVEEFTVVGAAPGAPRCGYVVARSVEVAASGSVVVVATEANAEVVVSRFGIDEQPVTTVEPGRPRRLRFDSAGFLGTPWTVEVSGGCLVPG